LNASHIWVGGGFVPQFLEKENTRKPNGGITLNKAWFFDGLSWISIKEMGEKRNLAACSIVYDQNGEVYVGYKINKVEIHKTFKANS